VTFSPDWEIKKEKDLTLFDNHHLQHKNKGESIISKMSQRFALDPEAPAE